MTPSVAARISSNLSRPSWFSILAMILMSLPSGPRTWLESGLGSGLVRVKGSLPSELVQRVGAGAGG